MDKPEGSEIARTEVTKVLVSYIKNNNLLEQGEDLKNKIVPDAKLKTLLGIENGELNDLTYFNIQKYMNKHFYSNKSTNLNPLI
jgi:chromatin remodeling complex protein RSC6